MEITFKDLQYLVTVVADDLLGDDFSNFQNGLDPSTVPSSKFLSDISEEMYDKVKVLSSLLNELYKYRPLPF